MILFKNTFTSCLQVMEPIDGPLVMYEDSRTIIYIASNLRIQQIDSSDWYLGYSFHIRTDIINAQILFSTSVLKLEIILHGYYVQNSLIFS